MKLIASQNGVDASGGRRDPTYLGVSCFSFEGMIGMTGVRFGRPFGGFEDVYRSLCWKG